VGEIAVMKGRDLMECTIALLWSDESNKWYTETNDVPGMVLESNSFDALMEKVQLIAPDMLEANCNYTGPIKFIFTANHTKTIREFPIQSIA
jgi:hypothetical protein